MNMKCPHPVLLLYGIGVAAYAAYFHLFPKTEEQIDGGGRFAIMAFMPLIILFIALIILHSGLLIGALCRVIAKCLRIECDEDEPPSIH
jgi:hypothetical protein